MDFGIYAGDTSKTIYLRLRDSTTGLGKTGLVYNSAGFTCSYTLPLAARAAIVLVTQTVAGAWSSGGFVEVDATNCKGLYRLDLPNAAIASGAFTVISIEFDGIIEESMEIPLHTRAVNVTQLGGVVQSLTDLKDFADAGYDPATNKVQGVVLADTVTTLTGHTVQTGDSFARIGATGSGLSSLAQAATVALEATLEAIKGATWAAGTDTLEAIRDRGDAAWLTAAGFSTHDAAAVLAAIQAAGTHLTLIKAVTDVIPDAGALTALLASIASILEDTGTTLPATLAVIAGYLDTEIAAILEDTGTTIPATLAVIQAVTDALPEAGALTTLLANVAAILTDTGTDGVAVAAASKTGYALTAGERGSIAAALLGLADGVETGITPRQALRGIAAVCAGILSGGGTSPNVIKAIGAAADGTTRVTSTVDADGNRSEVVLNL